VTLPAPQLVRWQPLRAGLLNLYHYDDLRLQFEAGRLLLRGNNGTGKSRILALQLPFLLDGEISPSRVEPDGDPSKRIEWHLLLDKYDDRVGYSWLEFGRLDDDGDAHFVTIGCGMKAVKGQGAPARWFFVTDQRIDAQLQLTNKSKIPLGRAALQDAIGEQGRLFDKASEYRIAVDQALFELGKQRYEALMDLLIQLRRPQLSRKLDAKALSAALSRAMPPVSERTIADVAEAFRSLEQDRNALEQDRSALESTKVFQKSYRRYVRIATRRRAEKLRKCHSDYVHTRGSLREAEAQLETTRQECEDILNEQAAIERERIRVDAAFDELRDDPAHHDARRLAEAGESERRAEHEVEDVRGRAVQSQARLALERAALDKAGIAVERGEMAFSEARDHAEKHAAKVGLGDLLATLDEHGVDQQLAARDRQVRHLRERAGERDREQHELNGARHDAKTARSELERIIEHRNAKQLERDEVREKLERDLEAWLDNLEILQVTDTSADSMFEALVDWSVRGDGEGPITAVVARAHTNAVAQLSTRIAELDGETRILRARRDGLDAEFDELSGGGLARRPRPPEWRDQESRTTRDGAPLWALCDFVDRVTPEERVGFEAALEASGLLDAWVTPDGRVLDAHDSFLRADEPLERSLADVLVPAIDKAEPRARLVDESTVAAILASIGTQPRDNRAWVTNDGRFSLGPVSGRGHKDAVEHIGHGAREQARRRRLEQITTELDELAEQMAALQQEVSACKSRLGLANDERDRAPLGTALRDAARELATVEREQQRRAQLSRDANESEELAAVALRTAVDRLRKDAEQFGLSDWVDSLAELDAALLELHKALVKVWSARSGLGQLQQSHQERSDAVQRANEAATSDEARLQQAERQLEEATARHAALWEMVGTKVEDLRRKLGDLRKRKNEIADEIEQLRGRKSDADKSFGAAETAVKERGAKLHEQDQKRQEAILDLQSLARTGVWSILGEEWREHDKQPDWSPTAAIDIARELEKSLQQVESGPNAWDNVTSTLQRGVQDLISALSSHGFTPTAAEAADVLVVTISYQSRSLDPSALAQVLDEEVANRERILNEREREILENHLIVEVASHLHDRIRGGEHLVANMNRQIENRPLSTGMRFRFKWVPIAEPELVEVRKRLLAAQGAWSPEDRKAISRFLQQRIQDERARSETGTWADHLTRALDYRDWHEFQIERWQNDAWSKLTKKTYGTGSGGEKAIALTLPQLAAAAAHYSGASERAPRLILMDEAFVGIDSDMRAKCMGLLAAFDLDFVMTSEREWGCFDTLPALAIYHLVTRPGVDAVHETRWVWNGRERVRDVG
jgi:uncharacterized protein (TIGR02680 family)